MITQDPQHLALPLKFDRYSSLIRYPPEVFVGQAREGNDLICVFTHLLRYSFTHFSIKALMVVSSWAALILSIWYLLAGRLTLRRRTFSLVASSIAAWCVTVWRGPVPLRASGIDHPQQLVLDG